MSQNVTDARGLGIGRRQKTSNAIASAMEPALFSSFAKIVTSEGKATPAIHSIILVQPRVPGSFRCNCRSPLSPNTRVLGSLPSIIPVSSIFDLFPG